jgi:hypothetical protein
VRIKLALVGALFGEYYSVMVIDDASFHIVNDGEKS